MTGASRRVQEHRQPAAFHYARLEKYHTDKSLQEVLHRPFEPTRQIRHYFRVARDTPEIGLVCAMGAIACSRPPWLSEGIPTYF
jgi:hypothetical protein